MVAPPMRRAAPAAIALAAFVGCLAAPPARAGEARCWVDRGAVVVSAAFGEITGDFILDLAAPHSLLHVDRALSDGIVTPTADATLSFARERIPARFTVASLDDRSLGLPTTINGLIGADVLAGYVVDIRLSPCRIRLWRGRAPALGPSRTLPVKMVGGVPTVGASITDGRTALAGRFGVGAGSPGVRLAASAATLSRTPKGVDPAALYDPPARLAALGLGDQALQDLPASLASDLPAGVLGDIGTDVWARYGALRLDLRRDRLQLAPAARPVSGRRRARSAGS
jgi:hypothetical protein